MSNGTETENKPPRPVSPINGQPIPTGRPRGATTKKTDRARQAVAFFVDDNVGKLGDWLDRIAQDDPKGAFQAFMAVVEYHIPKLARQEVVGDAENPLVVRHDVSITGRVLASLPEAELKRLEADLLANAIDVTPNQEAQLVEPEKP